MRSGPDTGVEAVARALLYEGYSLYPYRASALKNRRRLLFGTLMPREWAEAQGAGEPWSAATEVVLAADDAGASVVVSLRFLRLEEQPREIVIDVPIFDAADGTRHESFDAEGLSIRVVTCATRVRDGVFRIRVEVENTSALSPAACREDAERHAMGAAHVVLLAPGGEWVSQIDPPAEVADVAATCKQSGLFPVLVGPARARAAMLAAPIILYDHPSVAPESEGDLFDATEIEEILSLRVQTLTDSEKADVRAQGDPRLTALLDRVEALGPGGLARLHGAIRGEAPSGLDRPRSFAVGERVRLRPRSRADAMDVVLAGLDATIVSIESTLEGEELFCVTIDRDPGRDLGERGFPGHRFFFRLDEMEAAS
jgi:hypothetical protein